MITTDLIMTIALTVAAVLLYFLAGYAEKVKNNKWRLLYFIPLAACALACGVKGMDLCMTGVYIAAAVLVTGLITDKAKYRRPACAAAVAGCVISVVLCNLSPSYRRVDFVADFEKGFDDMRQRYVLSEHKDIDWDSLYAEYLPQFKEANRTRDEVKNCVTWLKFTAEFCDGHVGYSGVSVTDDKNFEQKVNDYLYGNDYGLSLMGLSDGSFVAVNVEQDSALTAAGIHNGTVVTSWDGMEIPEAAKLSEANAAINFADRDNELFYQPVYAAGVGGEAVTLGYISDGGEECNITLTKLGSYTERFNSTIDIINRGVNIGNLEWTAVSDDTVCLRIKAMMSTAKEELSVDFTPMQSGIIDKLAEYEAAGADKLIIDMRSNGGGSGAMVAAIAELLAPVGEHYYATDGLWDKENNCYKTDTAGAYVGGNKFVYNGRDIWGGKPIVILVNAYSVSAADHLTAIMSGFDNVTVIGFTEPNGSAQGVGSVQLETGVLAYSACLLLDENGDIFIDSGADGESANGVDIIVPFDMQAVTALFDNGEDYVLNYALEYLSE